MTRFKVKFFDQLLKVGCFVTLCCGGVSPLWADGPAVPAGTPQGAAPSAQPPAFLGSSLVPMLLMGGVFYFLLLRPQQKRLKAQQEMLNALKQGDEIVTTSGILGKITGITEKVVTVEVADNVKVKMLKTQVSQVIKNSIQEIA